MFNILTNTITGIVETAVNTVKLPIAAVISPIDDGDAIKDSVDGVVKGIKKIGKTK